MQFHLIGSILTVLQCFSWNSFVLNGFWFFDNSCERNWIFGLLWRYWWCLHLVLKSAKILLKIKLFIFFRMLWCFLICEYCGSGTASLLMVRIGATYKRIRFYYRIHDKMTRRWTSFIIIQLILELKRVHRWVVRNLLICLKWNHFVFVGLIYIGHFLFVDA